MRWEFSVGSGRRQRDPLESKGGSHNKAAKMIKKKKNRARTMGEGGVSKAEWIKSSKEENKVEAKG